MGIISKGILGGFSGTVGTVIGGTWKGITYMRSQPARRSSEATQAQLEQQAKFALAIRFVSLFGNLFMISFRNYAVKMTGTNNALSYTLKNAIAGTYPNYEIDYSNVLVSRGDLPNVLNPTAAPSGTSDITFSWTSNSGTVKQKQAIRPSWLFIVLRLSWACTPPAALCEALVQKCLTPRYLPAR
jgi:hypothetical protein